jgi:hypothetical protein
VLGCYDAVGIDNHITAPSDKDHGLIHGENAALERERILSRKIQIVGFRFFQDDIDHGQ